MPQKFGRLKHHDVTQLEIEFEESRKGLHTAIDRFADAATAFAKASGEQKAVRKSVSEMRKRLSHVVRIQSMTKRLTAREIWHLIYNRLLDETGYNAIARSVAAGDKNHIECVERDGFLPKLVTIAAAL